jgi:hypothetical protein
MHRIIEHLHAPNTHVTVMLSQSFVAKSRTLASFVKARTIAKTQSCQELFTLPHRRSRLQRVVLTTSSIMEVPSHKPNEKNTFTVLITGANR